MDALPFASHPNRRNHPLCARLCCTKTGRPTVAVQGTNSTGCHHVVIAHNHPNGRLYPSEEDLLFTQKLSRELKHIGAELVAHYLISGRNYLKIDIHLRTFSGSLTPLVCGEMQQDQKPIAQTDNIGRQTKERE